MQHLSLQVIGAVLFTLAGPVAAQRTWIVDAANGTGTDFTDLPPAVAAAAAGDRILVRKGSYQPVTIGKPLRVVADLGASIRQPSFTGTALAIAGIGSGQTCVVQGFEIAPSPFSSSPGIAVTGCTGAVVLADLIVQTSTPAGGIAVKDCTAVTIAASLVRPLLVCEKSTISAQRCLFQAYDFPPSGPITNAITADQTNLELTQCQAFGSHGSGHAPSATAVRLWQSRLVLRGDASSRYVGGSYNNVPTSPSIDGAGSSTLLTDPAIVLTPPPVNLLSTDVRRLAALTATEGNVGGRLLLGLYSPATSWYALFVALPRPPFAIPPFGNQWMDLPTEILLVSGVQGTSERVALPLPVPADSGLRGLALSFQAFTGIGPVLGLSNPAVPVLH